MLHIGVKTILIPQSLLMSGNHIWSGCTVALTTTSAIYNIISRHIQFFHFQASIGLYEGYLAPQMTQKVHKISSHVILAEHVHNLQQTQCIQTFSLDQKWCYTVLSI